MSEIGTKLMNEGRQHLWATWHREANTRVGDGKTGRGMLSTPNSSGREERRMILGQLYMTKREKPTWITLLKCVSGVVLR